MKQYQRPISPHLSIYKPQITSILSISHRATGFALYVGAILLAWWLIGNIYGCGDCINVIINSQIGRILLILWSFALFYHLLNGIRHLFWDMGKGFAIKTVNVTGILVVLMALILTVFAWVVGSGVY